MVLPEVLEAWKCAHIGQAGLLFKLKQDLPSTYDLILKFYLEGKFFRVNEAGEYSFFAFGSFVSLVPFLYYVNPTHDSLNWLRIRKSPPKISTSHNLQVQLRNTEACCRRWRVKVNGSKSAHLTFTLHCQPSPSLTIIQFLFLLLNSFATWDFFFYIPICLKYKYIYMINHT